MIFPKSTFAKILILTGLILFGLIAVFLFATIKVDTDIKVTIPEPIEKTDLKKEHIIKVFVKKGPEVLVDQEKVIVKNLTDLLVDKIKATFKTVNMPTFNDPVLIMLNNEKGVDYKIYLEVYNQIKRTFNILRENKAQERFGKSFDELDREEQKNIREAVPFNLIEGEQ